MCLITRTAPHWGAAASQWVAIFFFSYPRGERDACVEYGDDARNDQRLARIQEFRGFQVEVQVQIVARNPVRNPGNHRDTRHHREVQTC